MTSITWDNFKPEVEKAIDMRKYGKKDLNQTKVVNALRRAGLSVAITSMVGKGFPDLVVAGTVNERLRAFVRPYTKTILVELKNPDMPPSGQKLTKDEINFMDEWKGEYLKTNNVDDILKTFGLI